MAEAAGIALALIPLIIEGLRQYEKSSETFKKFYKYRDTLKQYVSDLQLVKTIFKDTLTRILKDCVGELDLPLFLAEPGGNLWQDEALQESLQVRLGPSFTAFVGVVDDMLNTMTRMREKVGLDTANNVTWMSDESFKRHWKRLQLSLRDESICQLIKLMGKRNKDLTALIGHYQYMNSTKLPKTTFRARKYQRIREQARSLYSVLDHKFSWPCGCRIPHSASLRLEHRNGSTVFSPYQEQGTCFKVLFSFEPTRGVDFIEPPWAWRETRIEPLRTSPRSRAVGELSTHQKPVTPSVVPETTCLKTSAVFAATSISLAAVGGRGSVDSVQNQSPMPVQNLARVKPSPVRLKKVSFVLEDQTLSEEATSSNPSHIDADLSSEFRNIEGLCEAMVDVRESSCLGVLIDRDEKRHRLSIIDASSGKDAVETVSLQELLGQAPLGLEERLVLGVKLASTLLQLHNTPWLTETWGKFDVRFKKHQDNETIILSQPFFSRSFEPSVHRASSTLADTRSTFREIRNPSIFSLGLILIELWFGKPIQDLRSPDDLGPQNQPNGITDFATTRALLNTVYDEAGELYCHAVQKCIFYEFDWKPNSLEVEEIKEAMHVEVICPLEKNLDTFCKRRLRELLN